MTTPWRTGLFGATALAFVLAACGGTSSLNARRPPSALDVVSAAYNSTAAARTARVSFSAVGSLGSSGSQANFTTSGQGVMDFAAKAFDLTANLPTGGTSEILGVGNMEYVKIPPSLGTSPALQGKSWLSHTQGSGGLLGNAPEDPSQLLGYLRGVSSNVTKIATENVRGTPTTRYRLAVDLNRAAAKDSPQGQAADKQIESLLHGSSLPVDVWTDTEGRARRIRMQVPVPQSPSSTPASSPARVGQVGFTLDIYDFGTPVNIQPPPSSQVYSGPVPPSGAIRPAA